jgi:hypothetical protein
MASGTARIAELFGDTVDEREQVRRNTMIAVRISARGSTRAACPFAGQERELDRGQVAQPAVAGR